MSAMHRRRRPGETRRAGSTPTITREQFPHVAEFLRGYLHQDFEREYGSAGAALNAYLAEVSAVERQAFDDERASLSARWSGISLAAIRRALAGEFRSAWAPATRDELDHVLGAPEESV